MQPITQVGAEILQPGVGPSCQSVVVLGVPGIAHNTLTAIRFEISADAANYTIDNLLSAAYQDLLRYFRDYFCNALPLHFLILSRLLGGTAVQYHNCKQAQKSSLCTLHLSPSTLRACVCCLWTSSVLCGCLWVACCFYRLDDHAVEACHCALLVCRGGATQHAHLEPSYANTTLCVVLCVLLQRRNGRGLLGSGICCTQCK